MSNDFTGKKLSQAEIDELKARAAEFNSVWRVKSEVQW